MSSNGVQKAELFHRIRIEGTAGSQEVDNKRKKKDICEEFSIAKSTLSTFIEDHEKLQNLCV